MMSEIKQSKTDLINEHKELKEKFDACRPNNPDREVYSLKLKRIEERLKSDLFEKIPTEDGEYTPTRQQPFANK